jgi:hypothetical protein
MSSLQQNEHANSRRGGNINKNILLLLWGDSFAHAMESDHE